MAGRSFNAAGQHGRGFQPLRSSPEAIRPSLLAEAGEVNLSLVIDEEWTFDQIAILTKQFEFLV